jgi:hypothetical protein
MSNIYEPDSRYLERLEWQLSSEYRRANRLKAASGRIAVPRRMAAISLAVGILMTGVAVTKAADLIKDSWRKKIEIARAETAVELKRVHLGSIREMASRMKMRAAEGLIREDEYRSIDLAAMNAELDLKRSLSNLEEVKTSGQPPRNELSAPLVDGRDFVSERLNIEEEGIELDREQLRIQQERLNRLLEQNLVRGDEMVQLQAAIDNRKMMIDKIQRKLDLRARFLSGEITAQKMEIEDRMIEAERNLRLAQSKVESLKEQLDRLEVLEARGAISPMEVSRLRYALDAAQAERKLAALEWDVLEKLR